MLTTADVARLLGVTSATIANYVKQGWLTPLVKQPTYMIYTNEAVEEFRRDRWPLLHPGPGKGRGSRR